MLHHLFGRLRVIKRVRENPPGAAPTGKIRALHVNTPHRAPLFQDGVAHIIAAHVLVVRRPADLQLRYLRAIRQHFPQPLAEQPVNGSLHIQGRGQHAHPHVLTLRRPGPHDPRRDLTRRHRRPRKARIDNEQQLIRPRLRTRRHQVADSHPRRRARCRVTRQQPQTVGVRADRMPAPQHHQRAARQRTRQPPQPPANSRLSRITQDLRLEGITQHADERLNIRHSMIKTHRRSVTGISNPNPEKMPKRHRPTPLPGTPRKPLHPSCQYPVSQTQFRAMCGMIFHDAGGGHAESPGRPQRTVNQVHS